MPLIADSFTAIRARMNGEVQPDILPVSGRIFDKIVVSEFRVNFPKGTLHITEDGLSSVARAVKWINAASPDSVRVEGFAVSGEGAPYNWSEMILASKRTTAVCDLLQERCSVRIRNMETVPAIHVLDAGSPENPVQGVVEILCERNR